MLQGIYTELKLNNKEKTHCLQHCGVRRHAYNWGLDLIIKKLEAKEKIPSAIDMHKLLVKEVKPENMWYYEVSKCSPQQALRDLETALKKFCKEKHPANKKKQFKDRYHKKFLKQYAIGKIKQLLFKHEKGFPQYKKKGVNDSFYLEGNIRIECNRIKVPVFGWIRTHEKIGFDEAKNVTISRRADGWFLSYKREVIKTIDTENRKGTTGADVGIKTLCTLADGTTFVNPKAYKINKSRLRKLQRSNARQYEACKNNKDEKGKIIFSNNFQKIKQKISKTHLRISNVRKDSTHKLTNYIVKNHDRIVIEDLNVSGMMKNHNLAGAIADGGFYEFKRQLEYKCKWYGAELIIADRYFASSKTCSCCGYKKEKLSLKERVFNCEKCFLSIDRDLNAAINLKNYAVSGTVKACGDSKVHPEVIQEVGIHEAGIRQQTLTSRMSKFV